MGLKPLYLSFFLLFPFTAWAEEGECISDEVLMQQAVLIQKQGHGKGSGILYSPSVVLTNQHVVEDIDKVWVYVPRLQRSISATTLHLQVPPDIAVLKLAEEVPDTPSFTVQDRLEKGQPLRLVSMPFAQPHKLNAVGGIYNHPIKLQGSPPGKSQNMNITLSDWAYAGDSGGAYFTCEGKLAGIHFGNQGHKNKPKNAFAVNGFGVLEALKKAGIE